LQALASYEKFIRDLLPERLHKFEQEKARARAWLRALDATPDFGKALFTLVRQAENEVRQSMGIRRYCMVGYSILRVVIAC
jgi:hypothetical protein